MSAKRCIELIRVSTAGQAADDKASIPAQHTINLRTAQQHGLKIVRSIEIADVSGANVLRSPEMQELLTLIQDQEIVGVVCREFSRLMRPDNYDDLSLLQRFVDTGTAIYLPDGRVDPNDLLLTMVRAGVAGKERKEMLERAWASKEEKRQRGELAQGQICRPWGVDYHKDERGNFEWRYKPVEAEKVTQAYRQVLRGEANYSRIAEQLGVTPRGAALILRNPIWKGWRIIDKKRDPASTGKYSRQDGRQADRRKIQRSADEIIKVQVIKRPLITEAQWERAQQIMQQKQSLHWRNRKDYKPRFTYAGFLSCARCGQPVHSVLARRDYYVCRASRLDHTCKAGYMRREQLEQILDKLFSDHLTNPKFVSQCLASLRRQQQAATDARRIPQLQQAVEQLRRRRTQVTDLFLEGKFDRAEYDQVAEYRVTAVGLTVGRSCFSTPAHADFTMTAPMSATVRRP